MDGSSPELKAAGSPCGHHERHGKDSHAVLDEGPRLRNPGPSGGPLTLWVRFLLRPLSGKHFRKFRLELFLCVVETQTDSDL